MKQLEHSSRPMSSTDKNLHGAPIPVLDHGYLRKVAHLGNDLTPLEAARLKQ